MKHLLFALFALVVGLVAAPRAALAYTPPPMTAHVTDTAGKLTESERLALDRKLEDYRLRTTIEIAVFLPKSLEGNDIEDVANATARAWRLGAKGTKNGVLLVLAPAERRARIEVAQGNQGSLTDLQANDIIRQKIRPHLRPGHEDYAAAVNDATDAIMADLGGMTVATPPVKRAPSHVGPGDVFFGLVMLALVFGVPILFFILVLRGILSAFSSHGRSASRGWASGGSWSSDSSWSSGGLSWSSGGGFGGGGDSGFSGGGGGGFDGGGSSDSF